MLDLSDPLVAIAAWGILLLVRKYSPKKMASWVRPALPFLAVLVAVFIRAGISASEGEPLTMGVLLRAVEAGGAAVLAHSQLRELVKVATRKAIGKREVEALEEKGGEKKR